MFRPERQGTCPPPPIFIPQLPGLGKADPPPSHPYPTVPPWGSIAVATSWAWRN